MLENFKKLLKWAFRNKILVFFFFVITSIFLLNSLHILYPDEYDNFLGGLLIVRGKLPYINYFAHHGPGAYYIAALISIFSGPKIVYFRIIYNFLIAVFLIWNFFLFSRKIKISYYFFYLFLILSSLLSIYFWGTLLVADSLAGWLTVTPYGLVFLKLFYDKKLDTKDLWIVSIFTGYIYITSLSYAVALLLLISFTILNFYWQNKSKLKLKTILSPLLIFITPFLLFFLYLLITGSLKEYIFQNFTYNFKYYASGINGVEATETISYLKAVLMLFMDKFFAALRLSKDLNFKYPLIPTLVVGNVILFINLILKKKIHLLLFIFLFFAYLSVRSNPFDIAERDYQAAPYIILSLFNTSFISMYIIQNFQRFKGEIIKVINFLMFLFLATYMISLLIFAFNFSYTKFNQAITKKITLINNHSAVAPYINALTNENDYVWVGPFAFEEWVYIKAKSPSKYYWILGAHAKSSKIITEIAQDFENNSPKIIVFNRLYSQFNSFPKDFHWILLNWMEGKYFRLEDLNKDGRIYEATPNTLRSITLDYEFERDFYFKISQKEEIVKLLLEKNMIREVN